jgi:hypothetical protein
MTDTVYRDSYLMAQHRRTEIAHHLHGGMMGLPHKENYTRTPGEEQQVLVRQPALEQRVELLLCHALLLLCRIDVGPLLPL